MDEILCTRMERIEQQRPPPPEPTQKPPNVNWSRTFPSRSLSEVDKLRLRNQELKRENIRLRNYIHDSTMKDIPNVQLKPVDSMIDVYKKLMNIYKNAISDGIFNRRLFRMFIMSRRNIFNRRSVRMHNG